MMTFIAEFRKPGSMFVEHWFPKNMLTLNVKTNLIVQNKTTFIQISFEILVVVVVVELVVAHA